MFSTQRANEFPKNLSIDELSSVIGNIKLDGSTHTFTLTKMLTHQQTLETIKNDLGNIKKEILKFLPDNIKDKNGEDSLAAMFITFNMKLTEDLDGCLIKITSLYGIFD